MPTDPVAFEVQKSDWKQHRIVPDAPPELGERQVLFRVDRFALTSNNISYALAGDMLGYWKFFPASAEGWGRIPAMGFGDVVRSRHPEVEEGTRCFGFFPMAAHLVVQAEGASPGGFVDAAPHRSESAPAYRQYTRTTGDPIYEEAHEDAILLLRGLFMTSFLVDDALAEQDFYGAKSALVASASSKTAIALAQLLSQRGVTKVVGLTSPKNAAFVKGLGCYDEVVPYADVKSLPSDVPSVLVDMAGDGGLVNTLHHHLGDQMKYSCSVGATHWDAAPREEKLPGAEPTFFFAPAQLQKRVAEWGPDGFQERLGDSWRRFRASTDAWMKVVRGRGPAAVERTYDDVLSGRATPSEGHILSMWEEEA